MPLTRIPASGVVTATTFTFNSLAITATTVTASTITGAVVITGGLGIGGNSYIGGNLTVLGTINASISGVATSATNISGGTAGQLVYQSAPGVTAFAGPGSWGQFLISAGTSGPIYQSTLTTVGGNIIVTSNTAATTTGSGALQVVNGGVGIGGSIVAGGISTFTNTSPASSTNTGALQVVGGLGVWGNAFFGGIVTATTFIGSFSGTSNAATNLAGGTAGQVPYQTGAGATSFYGPGTAGQLLVSAGAAAPTYTNTSSIYVAAATNSVNLFGGTAGQLVYQSGANTSGFVGPGSWGQFLISTGANAPTYQSTLTTVGGNIIITSNTAASTTSSGALQVVNGGVGIGGGIVAGGISTFTNATSVSSTNTGALQVQGGLGVFGGGFFGGTVTATNFVGSISGSAGSLSNAVTFNNANTGDASGTTYNGSVARTISANTLGALSLTGGGTVSGAVTFSGPVTFGGTATYVLSTNTWYTDNILELHTPPGGVTAPWFADDGKDIGLRFHYYTNSTDTNAALVLDNTTKYLDWYSSGAESATGDFSTATFGIFRTANIKLVGGTANSGNTSSGDLTVLGGVGIGNNLYVAGNVTVGGTINASITGATTQVNTQIATASATYYPTFVDSNNASATAELVYTTSSFTINPATGNAVHTAIGAGTNGLQVLNGTQYLHLRGNMTAGANNNIVQAGDTGIIYSNGTIATGAFVIAPWNGVQGGIRMDSSGTVSINYTSAQSGAQLSVNGGVYVNGTVTATTFVGAFTGAVTGAASQLNTQIATANAAYYPTFVDSNNASATAEIHYTTSSFVINAATGNVGIGVASPSYTLDVSSAARFASNSSSRVLYLKQNATNAGNIIQFVDQADAQVWEIVGRNNQFYIYNTFQSAYSLYINSSTNAVTISGTSSYSGEKFAVNGGAYINGILTATTFVGAFTGAVTGAASQLNTQIATASATYYPTFVDSNNASATAEIHYTTSTFTVNPATGAVGINGVGGTALNLNVPSSITDKYFINATGAVNSFSVYENSQIPYINSYNSMHFRANQNGGSGGTIRLTGGTVGIGKAPALTTIGANILGAVALDVDDSSTTSALMNSNATNNVLYVRAPFNSNPASVANAGAKWGILFSGGPSADNTNYPVNATTSTLSKAAAIYAVSEDTGAGYNRKVGITLWTSGQDLSQTERMRLTGNGGLSFSGASGYGSSGQVLQSNGDAAPSWVNQSAIAAGSAPLTNTYVGYGSGSNLLTGSSNLTWNGSLLYANGGITFNGRLINNSSSLKTYGVYTGGQGNVNAVYEIMKISRDSANWSTNISYEITVYSTYYTSGGVTKWLLTYGYGDSGTLVCTYAAGGGRMRVYLGAEVSVNANCQYKPVYLDIPPYMQAGIEVRYSTTEVASVGAINSSGQVFFSAIMTASGGTGNFYSGDTHLVPTAGNVGIGTTSPASKLSVSGSNTTSVPLVDLVASGSGSYQRGVRLLNSGMSASDSIMYATGQADSAGNMGQMYFVYAGAASTSNRLSFGLHSQDNLLNLTYGGNIGISAASPGHKLDVQQTTTYSYAQGSYSSGATLSLRANSTTSNDYTGIRFVNSNGSREAFFGVVQGPTQAIGDFVFQTYNAFTTSYSEKMRIGHNGNVIVGGNGNTSTNKFEVVGTAGQLFSVSDTFTGTIFAVSDVSGIPSIEVLDTGLVKLAQYNGAVIISTSTAQAAQGLTVNTNTYVTSLGIGTPASGTTGEIRATNEVTAYYSDRRLKENVQVIGDAIVKVLSLTGITYTPNELAESYGYDRNKKLVGLFADEVEHALPEAVRPAPFDQDENGNSRSGENYKTVQYEKLVPLLVEAIKEQQRLIDKLYIEVKELKK